MGNRLLRYVKHADLEAYIQQGWHVAATLGSTHGHWSILMEYDESGMLIAETPAVTKRSVLEAAIAATADRGLNYGAPEDNFDRVARLWNVHMLNRFGTETFPGLTAADVAQMMVLIKVARLQNQPKHLDSWIDIAGYAACGGEITENQ